MLQKGSFYVWVCVCLAIKEHKLIRNQSVAGSTLPDLSEAAEQEKGESFFYSLWSTQDVGSCQRFVKGGHFLDLWEKNCSIQKR